PRPGKAHAGERVARKRGDHQRQPGDGDGDIERVEILPGKGLVFEDLEIVLPAPYAGNERGLPEDLRRALEARGNHPQEREDEGHRDDEQRDGPADAGNDPGLANGQRHCMSLRLSVICTTVRTSTMTNMIMASAEA